MEEEGLLPPVESEGDSSAMVEGTVEQGITKWAAAVGMAAAVPADTPATEASDESRLRSQRREPVAVEEGVTIIREAESD